MPNRNGTVPLIASICISLSVVLVLYNTEDNSLNMTNAGSRYATVEALVNHGTYAIDKTRYGSDIATIGMDSVKIGDHYYSSKPPTLPTVTAGVYWCLKAVTGKDIRNDEKEVIRICNQVAMGIPHLFFLVYFYRLMLLFARREEAVIAAVAAACFAFPGVGYATDMNNHSPAAAALIVGFYYACRIRHGVEVKSRHWLLSGLFCGLLPALDIPSFVISGAIGVYLFTCSSRKTLLWFVPAAMIPLFIHLGLTYIATGSIVPIYLQPELYFFEGSYWATHYDRSNLIEDPWYIYAFHMLVGHHGMVAMNPALVLSVIAMVRIWKARARLLPEVLVAVVSGLILMPLYIVKTEDYGGMCVGFRWLMPFMALLFAFFGVWVEQEFESRRHRQWVLTGLIAAVILVGNYHVNDALRSPWKHAKWYRLVNETIDDLCGCVR